MESTYTVYVHTSPSQKRYIGITCKSVARRWKRGKGYRTCSHFWNAIKKHGWDNFQHETIAEGLTEAEAKQLEKELIIVHKTRDPLFGYNMTDGGEGCCGCFPSDDTRAKLSAAQLGHQVSTSTREAISAAKKGRTLTAEHRAKIGAGNKGKVVPDEVRARMSAALIGNKNNVGHKRTEETKQKISAAMMGNHNTLGYKYTDASGRT